MSHRAVYKTTTAEFLDNLFGAASVGGGAFDDALRLLELGGSLSETTRELESREDGLPPGTADGFEAQWLSSSEQSGDNAVGRVLRQGYRAAVDLARARGVPIETFWTTGAGDDFELHICENSERISVFMFVPGNDTRDYGSRRAQSRSWVVRVGDLDDVDPAARREALDDGNPPVYRIQVSGSPTAESYET
jgi:hypothetical protein